MPIHVSSFLRAVSRVILVVGSALFTSLFMRSGWAAAGTTYDCIRARAKPRHRKRTLFALGLSATLGLNGQVEALRPTTEGADEQIVNLPVFSVATGTEGSYLASDSLTASRVRTQIKDLPYNVNVITSEFIQDFAAVDMIEELAYTSSFSSGQAADPDFSIRGMVSQVQLRNGFRAEIFRNSVATERVEVIKGPAAAVYGQASPGGLVNTITKRPKAKPGGSVLLSLGNYNFRRGEVELTGPLGAAGKGGLFKDTYYLFTFAHLHKDKVQDFAFDHQIQGSLALTKKLGPKTSVTIEGEYLYNNFQRQITVPVVARTTVGGVVVPVHVVWKELYTFSPAAPAGYDRRDQDRGSLSFEHEFNRSLSMRAMASYGRAPDDRLLLHGSATLLENPLRFTGRQPRLGNQRRSTYNFQMDFIGQFQTGSVKHQTLLTFDYSRYWSWRTDRTLSPASLNNDPAYNVPILFVDSPNYYAIDYDPALFKTLQSGADNLTWIYGAFLRHQVTAMNGRLIGMAALRYDYNKFNLADPLTPTPPDVFNRAAWCPQLGLNFRITDSIILYASRATSFVPPTSGSNPSLLFGGERPKNQRGLGYEAGIKASLFNQKLNFTLAGYEIERQDVAITEVNDATFTTYTVFAGLERSRGAEIDFNWRIGQGLQLFGGYGYSNTEIVDAGRDLDAIGRRPRSTPNDNGGAGLRYELPKSLVEGVVLTFGVTYMGNFNVTTPTTGGTAGTDGYIRTNNGQRDLVLPSYTLANAGASYVFRTGGLNRRKYVHRVQLNVKNIFDRDYVATTLRTSDGFAYIGSYKFSF